MKKLLYTIFTILCLSLVFTNKAWCPSIGGSIIGSQTSFTGLVQVSGQTATFNTIWLNGSMLSNVTGHTVQDEGVSLYPRTLLNFVGAGVTAADDGVDTTTVTIPGGGVGGGDNVTVNTIAVDTTADLDDDTDITFTLTDGGAGGPDLVRAYVVNDSHAHTGASLSAIDISADTNLTAGDFLTLTDDDLDVDTAAVTNGDITHLPTCDGVYDFLYTELPSGADPDVNTVGEVGRDTDDHWLRGYDGAIQYIYGQKIKTICFTVTNPDLLTETAFVPIWTNKTGATFNIIAVYSRSDVDDAVYTLKYTTNDDTDHTNLTTIEAITIATNGTGVFYNDLTAAIDDTTVETGKTIGFDNGATDCDFIHGVIVGYLDGDVN